MGVEEYQLSVLIVSDEEMGGKTGTEWLLENHPDEMKCDFAVSEMGGVNLSPGKIGFMIGEKGASWLRLSFTGTPQHGSVPFGSDNAVVKAGEAIKRLAEYNPPVTTRYLKYIAKGFGIKPIARLMLTNKILLPLILKRMVKSNPEMARSLHSLSRMTISPNITKGGLKANMIAASATVDVDVRTLPGQDLDYVTKHIHKALGKKLAKEAVKGYQIPTAAPSRFIPVGSSVAGQDIDEIRESDAFNKLLNMVNPNILRGR